VRAALNDLDSALSDCERSLVIRPNDPHLLNSRGFVRLKRMEYAEALADYNQALRIGPKNNRLFMASSLFGRGITQRRLGNTRIGDEDIGQADAISLSVRQTFEVFGVRP